MTTTTPTVQLDVSRGVATITLLSPSLSTAAKADLRDVLAQVGADDAVRAVVLTGTGRAFCFGQDLGEHAAKLAAPGEGSLSTVVEHYNPIVTSLATMAKPVVAAINGTCVGAGLGFALACDLRVAVTGARFGTAFHGIGLTCDSGLSASLARAVGSSRAGELVLLAEPFTAEQAQVWGLVRAVVDPADLAGHVAELAARLAAGPTRAYAESKALMADPRLAEVLSSEALAQARLGSTEDHHGAVAAFLAKQTPTFQGR